jgi:hypothetical protein
MLMLTAQAQSKDAKAYLSAFDNNLYSLKTKGLKDFVVDIASSRLSRQINEQLVFGKIDNLIFRVYWTASPERMAIEVLGMPSGFKELKEELKSNILAAIEDLLPMGVQQKFSDFKIIAGSNSREFVVQDQSGIAPIPTYILKFDTRDSLVEILGKKPVGSYRVKTTYAKESFANGKWVLKEQITSSEANGQTILSTKDLEYGDSNGVSVLKAVRISIVQKWENPEARPMESDEIFEFKNYKIDSGEGLKHFLGDSPK